MKEFNIGIEIECEGVENVIQDANFKAEHEGMLQQGVEYVLRKPLPLSKVGGALRGLFKKFTTEKFSQRCSTHIHVDVREMSRVELYNFITLYVMFEYALMELVQKERVGNLFCLPVFDSSATEEVLIKLANKSMDIQELNLDEWKYCAINLASVARLGSLEFRSLHGTKDPKEVFNWVKVHHNLAVYASKEGLTPDKLIVDSSARGCVNMFKDIMGKEFKLFSNLMGNDELEELLYQGVHNAQYFAFSGDWA